MSLSLTCQSDVTEAGTGRPEPAHRLWPLSRRSGRSPALPYPPLRPKTAYHMVPKTRQSARSLRVDFHVRRLPRSRSTHVKLYKPCMRTTPMIAILSDTDYLLVLEDIAELRSLIHKKLEAQLQELRGEASALARLSVLNSPGTREVMVSNWHTYPKPLRVGMPFAGSK